MISICCVMQYLGNLIQSRIKREREKRKDMWERVGKKSYISGETKHVFLNKIIFPLFFPAILVWSGFFFELWNKRVYWFGEQFFHSYFETMPIKNTLSWLWSNRAQRKTLLSKLWTVFSPDKNKSKQLNATVILCQKLWHRKGLPKCYPYILTGR